MKTGRDKKGFTGQMRIKEGPKCRMVPNHPRQRDTEKQYKPNDHKALRACSLHKYVFNIAVILVRFLFLVQMLSDSLTFGDKCMRWVIGWQRGALTVQPCCN